jgi:hypothetical protein
MFILKDSIVSGLLCRINTIILGYYCECSHVCIYNFQCLNHCQEWVIYCNTKKLFFSEDFYVFTVVYIWCQKRRL